MLEMLFIIFAFNFAVIKGDELIFKLAQLFSVNKTTHQLPTMVVAIILFKVEAELLLSLNDFAFSRILFIYCVILRSAFMLLSHVLEELILPVVLSITLLALVLPKYLLLS